MDPFNARVAIYLILFVCMMISPGPVVKILKVSMNESLAQDELVDLVIGISSVVAVVCLVGTDLV